MPDARTDQQNYPDETPSKVIDGLRKFFGIPRVEAETMFAETMSDRGGDSLEKLRESLGIPREEAADMLREMVKDRPWLGVHLPPLFGLTRLP